MASGLGMLKDLPCPAGSKCTAFKCLFHHPGEEVTAKAQPPAAYLGQKRTQPAADDAESARKRVKALTDAVSSSSASSPPSASAASLASLASSKQKTKAALTSLKSSSSVQYPAAKAGIAPLPHQKPAVASSTAKLTNTDATSRLAKVGREQTSSPTLKKKTETLNPRLVAKAPASHSHRWQLVKFLHQQLARLNSELKKIIKDDEADLLLTDQELIVRALDEEEETAINKCSVYSNSVKNRIASYKRMSVDAWKSERLASRDAALKAESATADAPDQVHPTAIETGLTHEQEVKFLHRLTLPLEGLERYGYVIKAPSDEDIEKAREAVEASGNAERCDRCQRRFFVFPGRRMEDGALTSNGPCTHHPGKYYFPQRLPVDRASGGRPPKKWRCCHEVVGESTGCTTVPTHVFKVVEVNRLASVLNFEETPPNANVPADRAVAFDCEMGYTVHGVELIRMTVISFPTYEELLDVLVQPVGEVLDLNTRYSGVSVDDMVDAVPWQPGQDHRPTILPATEPGLPPRRQLKRVPSPSHARDLLCSMIAPDTPVIGHGTENDLNALRLVHPTIVDTVLLYPHKRGLPIRNGLKYLMQTLLDRSIQMNTDVDEDKVGHDSAEDAKAAGELVRLKIKEEWAKMRQLGWSIDAEGQLRAGSGSGSGSASASASAAEGKGAKQ